MLISAGGAWLWMRIVTRADPQWKAKGHRWFLYLIAGVASVYLAMAFYRIGFFITGGGFHTPYEAADDFWFSILINGPAEEWAKFLVFWFIASGLGRVKEPRDGVIVAMMVALGFSFWENINYLIIYGAGSIPTRLLWATSGHMAYGAVWGYYSGLAILDPPPGKGLLKYRYAFASVFVISQVHGFFNFLAGQVGNGAALVLDVVIYIIVLLILVDVCRTPSAYQAYSYSKSADAVKAISQALLRDPGNRVLLKRLGFYYLALGKETEAHRNWILIPLKSRGSYLNAWIYILEVRRTRSGSAETFGGKFGSLLHAMRHESRAVLKRRLLFFLGDDASGWNEFISKWEEKTEVYRGFEESGKI